MFEACEAALGLLRSVFCGLFCSCFGCCCGAEADDDVVQEPPIERTGKRPPQDLKAYQWPRFFSGPDAGTEALLARRQTHAHDGAEGQRTPTADDLNRQYESLATIPVPPGALPAAAADALAPSFRPPLAAGDAALPLPQRRPSPRSMLEGSGGGGGGSGSGGGGGGGAEAAAVLLKDSQVQKQQQRAARSPGAPSSPLGAGAAKPPPRQRGSGAMSSGAGGGGSGSFVTCDSHESFVTCTAASAAHAGNEHDLEGFEDALTFGPSPPSSPPPRIESRSPSPLPPPAQARRGSGGGAAAGPMLVA